MRENWRARAIEILERKLHAQIFSIRERTVNVPNGKCYCCEKPLSGKVYILYGKERSWRGVIHEVYSLDQMCYISLRDQHRAFAE